MIKVDCERKASTTTEEPTTTTTTEAPITTTVSLEPKLSAYTGKLEEKEVERKEEKLRRMKKRKRKRKHRPPKTDHDFFDQVRNHHRGSASSNSMMDRGILSNLRLNILLTVILIPTIILIISLVACTLWYWRRRFRLEQNRLDFSNSVKLASANDRKETHASSNSNTNRPSAESTPTTTIPMDDSNSALGTTNSNIGSVFTVISRRLTL